MRPAVVSLRPVVSEDLPFLHAVYASTRADELALVDWTDAQKEAFVRMQFTAQDRQYREHYGDARFDVVLADGRPAGRLYVARWDSEIRIVDIALLPEFRGHGIGTGILEDLLAAGASEGRKVSIHVERFNRARRLYERLGFREAGEHGVYILMEWCPPVS